MPAIRTHSTAVDTESDWDGPGEVAAAPNEEATLRYMHAWIEAGADPDAKQSYKFPHHKAGTDTAAVIAGVNNALSRLPQADIPEGDRSGVEDHLRMHQEDAGTGEEEESTEDRADRTQLSPYPPSSLGTGLPGREREKEGTGQSASSTSLRAKHEPIRCFEGNAKPHEAFWNWRNAIENGHPEGEDEPQPEMELYGYISEYSWWDDDITPKMFKEDLYRYGNRGPVTIRMNSGGGDVIAASVMKAILIDYPGKVTVKIDGMAASAATIVAIAGDVVKMQESAYFMIHDPMTSFFFAVLNIEELSRLLDSLKTAKNGIIDAYTTKTGMSRERLGTMMTRETWMTAQEAVTMGFADEVITANDKKTKKVTALPQNTALINALRSYKNVPERLLASLDVHRTNPKPGNLQAKEDDTDASIKRLRAEARLYKKGEIR